MARSNVPSLRATARSSPSYAHSHATQLITVSSASSAVFSRMARAHDAESDIGRCANDAAIARRPRVRRAFATPSEAVMSRRGAEAPSQ